MSIECLYIYKTFREPFTFKKGKSISKIIFTYNIL